MGYGIRVVLVMNTKGGSGRNTLCRALASAVRRRVSHTLMPSTVLTKGEELMIVAYAAAAGRLPLYKQFCFLD